MAASAGVIANGCGESDVAALSFTSGSFTPVVNDRLFIACCARGATAPASIAPTASHSGGVWTFNQKVNLTTGTFRFNIWDVTFPAGVGAGALTFTMPISTDRCIWQTAYVREADIPGTAVTGTGTAAADDITISAPASSAIVLAAVLSRGNLTNIVPANSFVEISDIQCNVSARQQMQSRTGNTGVLVGWTGLGTAGNILAALTYPHLAVASVLRSPLIVHWPPT